MKSFSILIGVVLVAYALASSPVVQMHRVVREPMVYYEVSGGNETDPSAPINNFVLNDTKGQPCMLINMGVRFKFHYNSTKETNKTVLVDIPDTKTDSVIGKAHCEFGAKQQTATFEFYTNWTLTMVFNQSDTQYFVSSLSVTFDQHFFPNSTSSKKQFTATASYPDLFATPNANSYKCNSDDPVSGFASEYLEQATFNGVQLQAFLTTNSTKFATASVCRLDTEISNVVPIAVGAALALLVIIVLVAYLIGRARSKPKEGYVSI